MAAAGTGAWQGAVHVFRGFPPLLTFTTAGEPVATTAADTWNQTIALSRHEPSQSFARGKYGRKFDQVWHFCFSVGLCKTWSKAHIYFCILKNGFYRHLTIKSVFLSAVKKSELGSV